MAKIVHTRIEKRVSTGLVEGEEKIDVEDISDNTEADA